MYGSNADYTHALITWNTHYVVIHGRRYLIGDRDHEGNGPSVLEAHKMPRSDTEKAKAPQLSARQIRVVTSLMAGETVVAAAKSAGVSRETVHRWWREDFEFPATYNRGRRELLETTQCRLLALADQATETVKKAVEQGDTKTALVVLKGLVFQAPSSYPST